MEFLSRHQKTEKKTRKKLNYSKCKNVISFPINHNSSQNSSQKQFKKNSDNFRTQMLTTLGEFKTINVIAWLQLLTAHIFYADGKKNRLVRDKLYLVFRASCVCVKYLILANGLRCKQSAPAARFASCFAKKCNESKPVTPLV